MSLFTLCVILCNTFTYHSFYCSFYVIFLQLCCSFYNLYCAESLYSFFILLHHFSFPFRITFIYFFPHTFHSLLPCIYYCLSSALFILPSFSLSQIQRIYGENTGIREYRNTKIQKYRKKIKTTKKYRNKVYKFKKTKIQVYKNTKTQKYENKKCKTTHKKIQKI